MGSCQYPLWAPEINSRTQALADNYGFYAHQDHAARIGVGTDVLLCAGLSRWRACRFGDVADGGAGVPVRSGRRDPGDVGRLARVSWPTGRTLVHVLISGLLAQGLLFTCLYLALDARRARRARCGDHLDESGRHGGTGRDVPRRGADLDADRRAGARGGGGARRPARDA